MFISVVISTIGRPTLDKAVNSVLAQEADGFEYELIVVNDSGNPLPVQEWMADERVRVLDTPRRERSIARNTGAAISRGSHIYFLDDDDWVMPGAFSTLWDLYAQNKDAVLLYGGLRLIDIEGKLLGTLNLGVSGNCASHMLGGAFVAIGSAAIRQDAFFKVGGFNYFILSGEDKDFFRKLAMEGEFANTPTIVLSVLRGQGWQTSVDKNLSVEYLRASRERILELNNAFSLLSHSAITPYWKGRNLKAYMASAGWNLRHRELVTFIRRSWKSIHCLLGAGGAVFKPEFRQAMRDTQVPQTIDRAIAACK